MINEQEQRKINLNTLKKVIVDRVDFKEKWRRFSKGYYAVSNCGRIIRLKGGSGTRAKKIIKQNTTHRGYFKCSISVHGKIKTIYIHILVAKAFIGPKTSGYEVNHKDGNKSNNHIDNLEYFIRTRVAVCYWTSCIAQKWFRSLVSPLKDLKTS